jgi:hypothetical protein
VSWINAPICERCWIERNSEWEAVPSMSMRDLNATRLVSIRMPVRILEPEIEICHWCIHPTIFGAYVRVEATDG